MFKVVSQANTNLHLVRVNSVSYIYSSFVVPDPPGNLVALRVHMRAFSKC